MFFHFLGVMLSPPKVEKKKKQRYGFIPLRPLIGKNNSFLLNGDENKSYII